MNDGDFKKLTELMDIKIKENLYMSQQSKDKETSSLHKEILDKIGGLDEKVGGMKEIVESHDASINDFTKLLPELNEAIKAYRTTSIVGKIAIGIVVGVPAIATFVAGVTYLLDFSKGK